MSRINFISNKARDSAAYDATVDWLVVSEDYRRSLDSASQSNHGKVSNLNIVLLQRQRNPQLCRRCLVLFKFVAECSRVLCYVSKTIPYRYDSKSQEVFIHHSTLYMQPSSLINAQSPPFARFLHEQDILSDLLPYQ